MIMRVNTYQKIRVDRQADAGQARLLLNAPKGNILDRTMAIELTEAIEDLAPDPALRLVVLEGEGAHFSFGASVEEHRPDHVGRMLTDLHRLYYALLDLPLPTLALVRGQCLGGGLELASLCSFLVAEEGARLGQPEVQLGVFPPAAAAILPLKVGQSAAEDLIVTGRSLTAYEALAIGLVNKVVPPGQGAAAVEAFYQACLQPRSASSLRHATRAARWHFTAEVSRLLAELERYYLQDLMATHDAVEGIQAFLEKRPPVWLHR